MPVHSTLSSAETDAAGVSAFWAWSVLGLVALGHFAWWLRVSNAAHATAWPKGLVRAVSLASQVVAAVGVLALGLAGGKAALRGIAPLLELPAAWGLGPPGRWAAWGYGGFCLLWAVKTLALWSWSRWQGPPAELLEEKRLRYHRPLVSPHDDSPWTTLPPNTPALQSEHRLLQLPGNQSLHLEVNQRRLLVPGLAPELDGLRVVHFSDLHLAGAVPREFFQLAVEQAMLLQPELVAVTGDLVDRPECLPWLPEVLAPLRAPGGVLVVLGNHDRRLGAARLVQCLEQLDNLLYLGGRCVLLRVRGQNVLVAGSSWPWVGPRPDPQEAIQAASHEPVGLRLLVTHSPDEFPWAAGRGFQLVLAGHVHGGQIRLPLAGPLVAPSRYGVKYATGSVYRRGGAVMHVSRGLSGKCPLRFGCPPELTCLVLHAAQEVPR